MRRAPKTVLAVNSIRSALLRIAFIGVLSLVWHTQALADCSLTSTGFTPVNDLWPGSYQNYAGGLYPQGANNAPPEHLAAGIDRATNQIRPLNAFGDYDPVNGQIVMISVGMSNTTQEFSRFVPMASADPTKNPQLVIVDGAQSGKDASAWADPTAGTWTTVNFRLSSAGVTPAQVQVAWVKEAEKQPTLPFPLEAQGLQTNLEAIARNLKTNYPNIKIAYYSSRTRAYTQVKGSQSPEPYAYESAFSVRWMIENQINGTGNLNFDSNRGPVVAPWLAWGPYLWADGTNPRSDGFVWLCSDLQSDFTHPSASGETKVAQVLLAFFKTHATAAPWFLRPPAQQMSCSVSADPTSGSPGVAVTFSATATSPGRNVTQYAWTFDDGDFSLAQNPSKIFPVPGLYNVRLTVSDNAGNTITTTIPISVQTAPPTPTPTPPPDSNSHANSGANTYAHTDADSHPDNGTRGDYHQDG